MLAVHLEKGRVEIRRAPLPRVPNGFARIRLLAAGICSTDLQLQRGYYGFSGTPGHEFVGEVVDADERGWVGERVAGEINLACRQCKWCKRGLGRHCPQRTVLGIVKHPGAFREFLTLPVANLHRVPKSIPTDHAVFIEPIAAACEILDQMSIDPGERIAILGDGKLGLLIAQVLVAHGAKVHVYGRHRQKLKLAEDAGATTEVFPKKLPARSWPRVVDATGSQAGLAAAIEMCEPRGTVVMKSTVHGLVPIDTAPAIVNEITLVGSRCGRFEAAIPLLASGKVQVATLISEAFPLDRAGRAFSQAATKGVLKDSAATAYLGFARVHRTLVEMRRAILTAILLFSLAGCSVKKYAIKQLGNALSGIGDTFAQDDDPELIRSAVPFSLKLVETLLDGDPKNGQLLLAASKGFTQYAYAFVQEEADETEDRDRAAAQVLRQRAAKLYLRARNYGLNGLELHHPNFRDKLKQNPKQAVAELKKSDVPFAYWTALSWAAGLSAARDFTMLPEIPRFEALSARVLELDEAYEDGVIHTFLLTYEMSKLNPAADRAVRAKVHFDRSLALCSGKLAGPYVGFAENVAVFQKNKAEFQSMLNLALKVDLNKSPENRQLNMVMQRRARWLLSRTEKLFPQ